MRYLKQIALSLPLIFVGIHAGAQTLLSNIPYVDNGHERHVLDIYTPENTSSGKLPVMFWIHGGGWQAGDKSDVSERLLHFKGIKKGVSAIST
jgi:acetyl esterase/lipase